MYINKNKKIQSHHMCRKKHQIRNRFAIASILSGILDSVWQAHALKILARALRYDLGARRLINARAELCRRVVSLMRWFRICSLTTPSEPVGVNLYLCYDKRVGLAEREFLSLSYR